MSRLIANIDTRRIRENLKNRVVDGSMLMLAAAVLIALAASAGPH